MKVTLLARTMIYPGNMHQESGGQWNPEDDYDHAGTLSEFAGRQCYESWDRPNPVTATNMGYIKNIIDLDHTSVLEHGTVTLRFSGVSRSLTHELVRHRAGFSYSQLSQRYVPVNSNDFVIPPLYYPGWEWDENQPISETQGILERVWSQAIKDYDALMAIHHARLLAANVDPRKARKMAAEAARCVLPNMTPTAIVVTANHTAWRHFLTKRGAIDADAEIRQLAVEVYKLLDSIEPQIYQDFSTVPISLGKNVGALTVRRG